jgi:hypothetical protein
MDKKMVVCCQCGKQLMRCSARRLESEDFDFFCWECLSDFLNEERPYGMPELNIPF